MLNSGYILSALLLGSHFLSGSNAFMIPKNSIDGTFREISSHQNFMNQGIQYSAKQRFSFYLKDHQSFLEELNQHKIEYSIIFDKKEPQKTLTLIKYPGKEKLKFMQDQEIGGGPVNGLEMLTGLALSFAGLTVPFALFEHPEEGIYARSLNFIAMDPLKTKYNVMGFEFKMTSTIDHLKKSMQESETPVSAILLEGSYERVMDFFANDDDWIEVVKSN